MSTVSSVFLEHLNPEIREVLAAAPSVEMPQDREHLVDLALGGQGADRFEVVYELPDGERIVEAVAVRCRNGVAVNYPDPIMRRRDPDCMVVSDDRPTDKTRYEDRFGQPFAPLRREVLEWLKTQDLLVLPFHAGGDELKFPSLLIGPRNAAFFFAALADLQGMIPAAEMPDAFEPASIIFLAPPFRHTHCGGRQLVVHCRRPHMHEIFALNLYPGPSAKKGVYGVLLTAGEEQGFVTLHGSTVRVVTPYDNEVTIMHEGASGGGKSEMLEYPHRQADGRLRMAANLQTGEVRRLSLNQGCELRPVTDDMAFCHNERSRKTKRLVVSDAEQAWFVRVNHINRYGVDPHLEQLCIHPKEPLIFLNIDAVPRATSLIWEHVEDSPGKPCPNPRVIIPRRLIPNEIEGAVSIDVRSFGVRVPPCSRKKPSYGIFGFLHVLPPALAWLWRLVAPRGHDNPSISDTVGLSSEGVGSYWPFATGRRIDQANLLLRQIQQTPKTRYVLIPNQHVGIWQVGFMPQWIVREYLARRGGARFRGDQLVPARTPLAGYALNYLQIEGTQLPHWFLEVDQQPEVGTDGYDAGAEILRDFFHKELALYIEEPGLDELGRKVIECCLRDGTLEEYGELLPHPTL